VIIGIPKEIKTGEQRVAMTPANIELLINKGLQVLLQTDAGSAAGYPDAAYTAAGATLISDRAEIFTKQILFCRCSLSVLTMKTVTMI